MQKPFSTHESHLERRKTHAISPLPTVNLTVKNGYPIQFISLIENFNSQLYNFQPHQQSFGSPTQFYPPPLDRAPPFGRGKGQSSMPTLWKISPFAQCQSHCQK